MQPQTDIPTCHPSDGPLDGIRLLEVAGTFGGYAGKLFADFGADVTLVEPPVGAAMRRLGPFIDGVPGPERSLRFAYTHTSKRGITLDLDSSDGQELFRRLAGHADVILESEPAHVMDTRGLGHAELAATRPSLVYTSVTAFGQEGPNAGYHATDTVLLAMGGLLYLGGYPDTEPMRVYGDQAILAADQYAAAATMLAVLAAEERGEGRHVDVSAQECIVMALENSAQFYDLEGRIRVRTPPQHQAGRGVYPCRDGYVYLMAMARGVGTTRYWNPMAQWLIDEGVPDAGQLLDPKWVATEWAETEEGKAAFNQIFLPFAARKTRAELQQGAIERGFPLCPVNSPADLVQSPQLMHRGYFAEVQHALLGRPLLMPGAPFQLSQTPWRIRRPAPALGEHNGEVYGALGLDPGDLEHLAARGVI